MFAGNTRKLLIMHRHYVLCVIFIIYLSLLSNCANLEDPNKSKDTTLKDSSKQEIPKLKKTDEDNKVLENVKVTQNVPKDSDEQSDEIKNVLDDKKDDLQNKKSDLTEKKEDLEDKKSNLNEKKDTLPDSSLVYDPTYINKGDSSGKSFTAEDYEILEKIYIEEFQKEFIKNYDSTINKVKEKAKEKKEHKEFPGTAEETMLFEDIFLEEQDVKEYLLKVNEILSKNSGKEPQGSQLENPDPDTDPNPSFSDLNAKEILHTSIPEVLKPPASSENAKSKYSKEAELLKEKSKKEPELTEEEKQGMCYKIIKNLKKNKIK